MHTGQPPPARLGRSAAAGGGRKQQSRPQRAGPLLQRPAGHALHRIGQQPRKPAVHPDKPRAPTKLGLPLQGQVDAVGADGAKVNIGLGDAVDLPGAIAPDQLAKRVGRAVGRVAVGRVQIETVGQRRLRQRIQPDRIGDVDGIIIHRERQAMHHRRVPPGPQHRAQRQRIGLLWTERGIALNRRVYRRRCLDIAGIGRRAHLRQAQGGDLRHGARRRRGQRAGVRVGQTGDIAGGGNRRLGKAGHAHRPFIATPNHERRHHLPRRLAAPGPVVAIVAIARPAPAQIQIHRLGKGRIAQQRHQHLARQLAHLLRHRGDGILRDGRGDIGRVYAGAIGTGNGPVVAIRQGGIAVAPPRRGQRKPRVPGRQSAELTVQAALDHILSHGLRADGIRGEIGPARGRHRIVRSKRIIAPGADRIAPVGRVQQRLHTAEQYRVRLFLAHVGSAVVDIELPVPSWRGKVALQPSSHLPCLIGFVVNPPPKIIKSLEIVNRRIGVCPRCQQRRKVWRNERIAGRQHHVAPIDPALKHRIQRRTGRNGIADIGLHPAVGKEPLHKHGNGWRRLKTDRPGHCGALLRLDDVIIHPGHLVDGDTDRQDPVCPPLRIQIGPAHAGKHAAIVVHAKVGERGDRPGNAIFAIEQRSHRRRVGAAEGRHDLTRRQIAGRRPPATIERAALAACHHAPVGIAARQHDMAAPPGKLGPINRANVRFGAIAMLGNAGLARNLQPVEPVAQAKIHHARYRVRAIYRRSAAGGNLHLVDGDGGNGVYIHHPARRSHWQPHAIQQHQIALLAQPAQVHRGIAPATQRVVVGIGPHAKHGQLRQCRLDIDLNAKLQILGRGGHHRGRRCLVGARDAGAGDHDILRAGRIRREHSARHRRQTQLPPAPRIEARRYPCGAICHAMIAPVHGLHASRDRAIILPHAGFPPACPIPLKSTTFLLGKTPRKRDVRTRQRRKAAQPFQLANIKTPPLLNTPVSRQSGL